MPVRTAVVLAGGLGTRLRSAVPGVPKPLAPIRGRPFLDRLLRHWRLKGIDHFVLSVGYKHEMIQERYGSQFEGVEITYNVEPSLMGTGGGVLLSAPQDQQRFLLLNGDTYFDVDLPKLEDVHEQNNASVTFSVFRSDDSARYMAIELSEDDRVSAFGSAPKHSSFLVNGGVYLIETAVLEPFFPVTQPVSLESEIFPSLLQNKARLFGLEQKGRFIDIGVPQDFEYAQTFLPDVSDDH
jgi:D-glycero-alpha-D-manno-heptose 1-phosphate guanylyltransferase